MQKKIIALCLIIGVTYLMGCSAEKHKIEKEKSEMRIGKPIMITIYPSYTKRHTYLIKISDDGIIYTITGIRKSKQVKKEDFSDVENNAYRIIKDQKKRVLNDMEIEKINALTQNLKVNKLRTKKIKYFPHDWWECGIYINDNLYYLPVDIKEKNRKTFDKLVDFLIKSSPLDIVYYGGA